MSSTSSVHEVRTTPTTGNSLFARQDLASSAVVIQDDDPFVAVLDSPMLTVACSWCFFYAEEAAADEQVKLSACTGCKITRYCGKACQTAAWKHSHKYECKVFASLYPNVLPNTARMVLQVLLRRKYGTLPPDGWTSFLDLRHHLEDFKVQAQQGDETYRNLQLMARAATDYSKSGEDLGLVETLVGRLLINTLTLTSPLFTPLGLLLSLSISHANHSCQPTAVPTLSGRTLTLRTLDPVPAGSELTISYTDITVPPPERRAALQSRYHFRCACRACSSSLTLGHPDPPPALSSIPASNLDSILKRVNEFLVSAAQQPDQRARLEPLARAFVLLPPAYPAYRPPLSGVRTDLVHALLAHGRWVPALIQSLVQRVDADPVTIVQENHPVRVSRTWVLARLLAQVGGVANHKEDRGEEARAARALAEEFEVSYPLMLFVLVRDVTRRASVSHGMESRLALEAGRELGRLKEEVTVMGGKEPDDQTIGSVWEQMERLAREGWEWWKIRERGRIQSAGASGEMGEGIDILVNSTTN